MQLQIDFWQLLLALGTLVSAFATVVWLFGSHMIAQFDTRLDERFKSQELLRNENKEHLELRFDQLETLAKKTEQDVQVLNKALPTEYVRREDHIRGQSVIEAKLDALYSKMELVLIRGSKHD